jgi:aspartate racemase
MGNFIVDPIGFDASVTRLDLEAYFWDLPEGLGCEFVYSTDLFDRHTIQGLLQRFQILLEGIVSKPDCRISELPLLTETERQQLLVEWNDHHREYPQDECVPELFEAQVERTPDAVAIVFGQERLTYAELNRKSNQVAHYLRARGVGPEARVGILMERSLEMVVGLLGILKAGGAYVPLDPAHPRQRLSFMLEDAAAPVLLTQQQLVERPPAHVAEVICLDRDWQQIAKESAENPENNCTPQNLVYVIYTSGSTGKPKGVSVTHQSVVRLVKETDYAKFGPDEVFLQFAPLSFDASTFEIWGSLLNGARLVVMPPGLAALGELGEAVKRNGVTTLWLTAGLFHQIVETDLENLRGVRQLLAGGDVLSVPHLEKAADELSGCQLINGYGPTENTTFTCCYRVKSGERFESSVPIGFPITNTEVYILDRQTELAPIGVAGELYIGGHGLARGYLNRPDLTAERFVPNPFSSRADERLYKTGDLARYRPDGSIQFLGRLDHQVKLRGYRIELGEIETALGEHSSVQDAVVILRDSERGNRDLVAYVVADPGEVGADFREQLQGFLKKKLPGYMTPAYFVFLEKLPLTPNGKIDQRALPLPEKSRPDLADAFVAPRSEAEIKLASLWRDVLGREEIGIYDNFFDLGGHSLLATQVMARIRETFNVNLPLRYFFEQPTVAGLAEFLRNAGSEDRTVVPEIRRLPRG